MAEREKVQVVNNTLEIEGEFAGGYTNGYLYYYDTNHQLPRPFTGEGIYALMQENLCDHQETAEWNAGFVFGWITALCENNPAFFFTSIILPESVNVAEALPAVTLQEA